MAEGRIRLTVLGGYLGSGKTTWLRHQLSNDPSPPHVIVNEAAELPVDKLLLGRAAGLTVLAGGCACCVGRDELLRTLRSICDTRDKPDRIILETSGLADPGAIVAAIRGDPVLVHHILVTEIVVLVDALNALSHLASDALGRAQIAAADRIILTKIDCIGATELATLALTVGLLNPGAPLSAAVAGSPCTLPPVPPGTVAASLPTLGQDLPPITAERINLDPDLDWAALSLWLSALLHARGDDLIRVKGVVHSPAGRLLLQAVRRIVQSPEILPDGPCHEQENALVFVGRGATASALVRSLTHFSGLG